MAKTLTTSNSFYQDLANVMDNPIIQEFVLRRFVTKEEIMTMAMFMKLYALLDMSTGSKLGKDEVIALVDKCIKDTDIRGQVVSQIFDLNVEDIIGNRLE